LRASRARATPRPANAIEWERCPRADLSNSAFRPGLEEVKARLVLRHEDRAEEADGLAFSSQLSGGFTYAVLALLDSLAALAGDIQLAEELRHGGDRTGVAVFAKYRKPGIYVSAGARL